MAERGNRDSLNLVRRPSFRKSLAEAGLPPEFLDQLETKRKALDDSIHKYIAAKEREYKSFEKELRAQHKIQQTQGDASAQRQRVSAEEAQKQSADKAPLSAVNALMQNGIRRDSDLFPPADNQGDGLGSSIADRHVVDAAAEPRTKIGREKEFIGVFTPQFLPMLETRQEIAARNLERERTNSAPPAVELIEDKDVQATENAMHRANSDTVVQAPQAQPKRPVHLQLSHRTSSSGSSVDGKLISAMKSPTEHARPKRKRVSLAVGDAIVAPSDNVPIALSTNSTPSHSRTRATGFERSSPPTQSSRPTNSGVEVNQTLKAERCIPETLNGAAVGGLRALHEQESEAARVAQPARPVATQTSTDDVGELWHMEETDTFEPGESTEPNIDSELEDDLGPTIAGRIGTMQPISLSSSPQTLSEDIQPLSSSAQSDIAPLPTTPTSAAASQQPTHAGFRRPSVARDPQYSGRDYMRDAMDAEEKGVYGSSFSRPGTRGSFGGGSLGESFMARHAAEMEIGRARGRDGRAG